MIQSLIINTDGGSRGNPGPAAAGFVIKTPQGIELISKGIFLGKQTNNYAEYTAVILGLKEAKDLCTEQVTVYSDSQLMVKQVNGEYKVKNVNIKPLHAEVMSLLKAFKKWNVEHVYRENNKEADEMANRSMDKKADVVISNIPKPTEQQFLFTEKEPLKLAVLLSGGGTTMVNIHEQIKSGNLNAEIKIVISSRDNIKGNLKASNLGLPLEIIRKNDFDNIDKFSNAIEEQLNKYSVDLVIQAGWLCLWKIPDKYENRVMNIHPALLPSFGGKGMWGHHVHDAVLNHGCKISGCTVHFCNNNYDEGPIIAQLSCPAYDDDTIDSLAARVFEQECIAYPEAIKLFEQKRLHVENSRVIIEKQ